MVPVLCLVLLAFQKYSAGAQNYQMCATVEAEKGETVLSKSKPVERIIGDAVKSTYAPFQVLLYTATKDGVPKSRCGGTIISEHFVLTAAHCVVDPLRYGTDAVDLKTHNVVVVFGLLNFCSLLGEVDKNSKGPRDNVNGFKEVISKGPRDNVNEVEHIIVHPDWNLDFNDIAILKVR